MSGNRDSKATTRRQLIVNRLNTDARTQKILPKTMLDDKNYYRIVSTELENSVAYGEKMVATLKNETKDELNFKLHFNKHFNDLERQADLVELTSEGKNYIKCAEIFQNQKKHEIPVYKFFAIDEDQNSRDFQELDRVVVEKTADDILKNGKSADAPDGESILTRM